MKRHLLKFFVLLGGGSILLLLRITGWASIKNYDIKTFMVGGGCLIALSSMGALYKIIRLWRRHDGTEFRFKVTGIFSLFVILPCIIMAIFAVLFLEIGVQAWFHKRVRTALQESHDVAKAYLNEHKKVIAHTILAMAKGLDMFLETLSENKIFFISNPEAFFNFYKHDLNEYLTVHETFRSVREAVIFMTVSELEGGNLSSSPSPYAPIKIMSSSAFSLSLGAKMLKKQDLEEAREKGIALFFNEQEDQVFAIVPVFYPLDAYLLVSRDIDKQVLKKINHTSEAVGAYENLLKKQKDFGLQFIVIFLFFTFILLGIAIWAGLLFSRQVMDPVGALINAAQKIKQGHMEMVNYEEMKTLKELHILMATFNSMVEEMAQKRQALMKANQNLNERTYFIKSVLEGVSSGVISLTSQKKITLANQRAQELLQQRKSLEGKLLDNVVEEFGPLFEKASAQPGHLVSDQLTITHLGRPITFQAHMKAYSKKGNVILTFDDITEVITAQKKTAWEDIARRIAHEVKNPLTPIMLSAERLKRRYLPIIHERRDIFQDCIDTIIRQVAHIGKLIREFSAFARMPSPVVQSVSFDDLIHQVIVLQEAAYPFIQFIYHRHPVSIECDVHQIEQVLINILKNAIESVSESKESRKVIKVALEEQEDKVILHIHDNGIGLPSCEEVTIGTPYITTKPHGMGLGLAIVQKIIYDHKGYFSLQPRKEGKGVHVVITLRKQLSLG